MVIKLFSLLALLCLSLTTFASENRQRWQCEAEPYVLGLQSISDEEVELAWRNQHYRLYRQVTASGAQRYTDEKSGMVIVIIPRKLMLFNRKQGTRLADNCQIQTQTANKK